MASIAGPDRIKKLAALQTAIGAYLQDGLGEGLLKATKARWIDSLSRVFSGLVVSLSSIVGEDGKISKALRSKFGELAREGIFFLFVDDHSANTDVGTLGVVVAFSKAATLSDIEARTRDLGYDINRLLIVTSSGSSLVSKTLDERQVYSGPLLISDFDEEKKNAYLSGCLPIVSGSRIALRGPESVEHLLDSLLFARRINVREFSLLVARAKEESGILNKLVDVSKKAKKHLDSSTADLLRQYPHLAKKDIFDHRSGAICFPPADWRKYLRLMPSSLNDYFSARLVGYWQPSHPCFRRVLYTPTRVLLRGEEYYVHMKNISPIDRLRAMLAEVGEIQTCRDGLRQLQQDSDPVARPEGWKLALAFLDQLRNIALQLFSFTHAVERLMTDAMSVEGVSATSTDEVSELARKLYTSKNSHLHIMVRNAVRAYYLCLLGDVNKSMAGLDDSLKAFTKMVGDLRELCTLVDAWFKKHGECRLNPKAVAGLVRRWREADHPGENLLVCHTAAKDLRGAKGAITAVGVGWGAIELPFVLQVLAGEDVCVEPYVASWSHYRDESAEVRWIPIQEDSVSSDFVPRDINVLMDDNVLTGTTLENVRDAMLLRGASEMRIYVTRFSGERRLGHMQMEGHGVIDPDFMLSNVKGYFGETAFSRSWSTKRGEYTSQIGVFSLGRRRILECIHNNSTVEAWDREGF